VERERLTLDVSDLGRADLRITDWLAGLRESRERTLVELEDVSDELLDVEVPNGPNTIGTLLYHIALIEADWLVADILGPESGVEIPAALFPLDDRDATGTLSVLRGEGLAEHLERLSRVRSLLESHLRDMPDGEFRRARSRDGYDVSAAWVLHHLLQHEAEHRAHIAWVRDVSMGTLGADRR
jgi:uncharacterized damage-inducible protein DinB